MKNGNGSGLIPGFRSTEPVQRHKLGVNESDFRAWIQHKPGDAAQLYPTNEDGVWMLGLERDIVQELASRAMDPMRIDQDTVDWQETITTAANRSGPTVLM